MELREIGKHLLKGSGAVSNDRANFLRLVNGECTLKESKELFCKNNRIAESEIDDETYARYLCSLGYDEAKKIYEETR